MSEAIPPLPGYDKYHEAAKKITPHFSVKAGRVSIQIPEERLIPLLNGVSNTTQYFARAVEPIDRATEKVADSEFASSFALVNGAVAGALIVDQVHGKAAELLKVRKRLSDVRRELYAQAEKEGDDALDIRHIAAGYIIDYGQRGIDLAGIKTEEVLEETEIRVIADVSRQRMFRVGAGVVLMAALELHSDAYFKDRMETLDASLTGVNWDSELEQLLSGGNEQQPDNS